MGSALCPARDPDFLMQACSLPTTQAKSRFRIWTPQHAQVIRVAGVHAGSCTGFMGQVTPALLPESSALATGGKLSQSSNVLLLF